MSRIDPATNKVVKRLMVGSGPCGVVAGGGALWVEDYYRPEIVRVDPRHFRVTKRIRVGREPGRRIRIWLGLVVEPAGQTSHASTRSEQGRQDDRFDGSTHPASVQAQARSRSATKGAPNIFRGSIRRRTR